MGPLKRSDRLGADVHPGGPLRREAGRVGEQRQQGRRGSQSDSAAAARSGAVNARR